jgi:hypothetical protein
MANKRTKRKKQEEQQTRPVSKEEKDMFSFKTRAHDKYGNPVWNS